MSHSSLTTIDLEDLGEDARKPLSAEPRAFLRWAGSKRLILPSIVPYLPNRFYTYREPFLGSGALYFLLRPKSAVLSDTCADLIDTFKAVRDNPKAVCENIRPLKPSREKFYDLRANRSQERFRRAAEFIYLNKTCWNGLYRVNSRGDFNVPFGWPKSDKIIDESNIDACAESLSSPACRLERGDFEVGLEGASTGDLVYLDPPYVTGHAANGFIDYNEVLFSWVDQERLACRAEELRRAGVFVMVSNAWHQSILNLYPHFRPVAIYRNSTLASDKAKRGPIKEVLLTPS